jgi:UDP-N-acetylglucosamine--N-acetylmuramyl-(pentapeptide) pyrophosphoryl-undecaprenol N-acetylglucosamine transferase
VRIIITGGGTGGHVFPGIAVAEAVVRLAPETEIVFVGGSNGIEATAVPKAGFPFLPIPAQGLLGKRLLVIPKVMWTTIRGLISSLRIMGEFKPDVVFATGGYVSGSVAMAAWLMRIPLVIQEQNSIPGLTNRLLSRIAREVFLNYASSRKHFPRRGHLKLSGSPIRLDVLTGEPERALRGLKLDREKQTVLILGGSQGARSINRAAITAIRLTRKRNDIQFILQTGRREYKRISHKLNNLRENVTVLPFIRHMGDMYSLANLVVTRAGAMSLAEVTACGKASILIPFPYATHNHQEENARVLVDVGAAQMIIDKQLTGEDLADRIVKLIDTPRKLREMSNNALSLARPDAAEKIATALLLYRQEDDGTGDEEDQRVHRSRPTNSNRSNRSSRSSQHGPRSGGASRSSSRSPRSSDSGRSSHSRRQSRPRRRGRQ